jgi:hypothetical protein
MSSWSRKGAGPQGYAAKNCFIVTLVIIYIRLSYCGV